jgi:hypothetical protein
MYTNEFFRNDPVFKKVRSSLVVGRQLLQQARDVTVEAAEIYTVPWRTLQ